MLITGIFSFLPTTVQSGPRNPASFAGKAFFNSTGEFLKMPTRDDER